MNVRETEGAIKNGQSRETGNIGYTRQDEDKKNHNTICVGHLHTQDIRRRQTKQNTQHIKN